MRDGQGCLLPVIHQSPKLPPSDEELPCLVLLQKGFCVEIVLVTTEGLEPAKSSRDRGENKRRKKGPKRLCQPNQEPEQPEHHPYLPGLDDETAIRCLAAAPLSGVIRLAELSYRHKDLVRSHAIFEARRRYGTVEQWVFIFTGAAGWTAFDPNRQVWMNLSMPHTGDEFGNSDRESLSAGTHLLWLGKEGFPFVCYRYDLATNQWERGPTMLTPRCLFASASCGEFAYVAGGFGAASDDPVRLNVLNTAERYNSVLGRWDPLPPMSIPRQKCSGFYMDGKFYVIGGRDANHQPISSGEEYNPVTRTWRTINNMYFAPQVAHMGNFEPSPPLVAVVNNQLYAIENTTNLLKVYQKSSNTWRDLGPLPVRADFLNGWGIAFKAIGDRLFVMGGISDPLRQEMDGIAVFCWQPRPDIGVPEWELLDARQRGTGTFLYNCAVMAC